MQMNFQNIYIILKLKIIYLKLLTKLLKLVKNKNELDAIISRYKIILTYNQKNRLRKLYSKRRRLLKLYTKNKEFMNEYAINSKNYFYIIICTSITFSH